MALLHATPARAADDSITSFNFFNAGFGITAGGGIGELNAEVRKAGFTTRRIQDGNRSGSLSLVAERYADGVPFELIDTGLRKKDVHLEYEALYVELKRFIPLWGPVNTFWGLRGGATRITGTVKQAGKDKEIQEDQAAPLWFLAVPVALENPGFLLLALVEGGSAGVSFDLVPNKVWLEAQITAAMIPGHRDRFFAIDTPFVVTRTLSISAAF